MRPFSGVEPLVGDIVGLRTFRVDDSGLLLPLYSNLSWYDGPNTATCSPPTGERGGEANGADQMHSTPSPDCECGFYAYGSESAAMQHRHMRYVQAVVSCWGTVVAGTQGVRAEHARIDAIWLHPNVPTWARRRVSSKYPSAQMYTERSAMLAEHPLSTLECYQEPARRRLLPWAGAGAAGAAFLGLGLVPPSLLHGSSLLWTTWLAAVITTALAVVWLLVGVHAIGHRAAALVALGVLAWLISPAFGLPGWLLRLPLLRAMIVAAAGFVASLRPGYFPIDRAPRERVFCGVRG
ncbi:MAG: hypothetical protein M3O28_02080 [Actinomycetota bacterium]|nr:hypothetical protein [Actinomycetota bacterium]